MAAGKYDIYIEQGATFELNITVDSSVDFNDYTARGQIKSSAQDSTPLVSFTFTVVTATQIKVSLTPNQTSGIKTQGKNYQDFALFYYDIELEKTADSSVLRLLNGSVKLSPEVTK